MTVTVVQSKVVTGAWTGSFGANVTAGNAVYLAAFSYTAAGATMSSSAPTFGGSAAAGAAQLVTGQNAGTNAVYGTIWRLPNLAGGAASFGLTPAGGTVDSNVGIVAVEVAGMGATPALDATTPNPKTASGSGTVISSGASGTTGTAAEFVMAFGVQFAGALTLPGGAFSGTLIPSSNFCAVGWQVASSTGTFTYTPTTATTQVWFAAVLADVPTAGGGGTSVTGVTATAAEAAPAGSVAAGATVAGAVGTATATAPAGSLSAGAAIAGPVSTAAAAALAGTVQAGAKVTGVVATAAAAASAGTIAAGAIVAGPVAAAAATAPAGAAGGGVLVSGVLATASASAPAGSVSASATVAGPLASASAVAPAGVVTTGVTVAGLAALAQATALAGLVSAGARVSGPVATAVLAAPAGSTGGATAPQQGTVTISNALAASVTIANALSATVTISNALAGSVTIVNTI